MILRKRSSRNRKRFTRWSEGQEFENGQRKQKHPRREPAINHFARAPKPGRGVRRAGCECAVSFQPENPARVQADGEIKVAGALISEAEQDAGQREAEKTGHERVK